MAAFKKTPGVYVEEKSAFGNSVVPVATAIPVFIGHTEKAAFDGKSLENQLVKIGSLVDYITFFGDGPQTQYTLAEAEAGKPFDLMLEDGKKYNVNLAEGAKQFYNYNSIRFFYENGGADAYVMSVGSYDDPVEKVKKEYKKKVYRYEANITKVSPRQKFVTIDKGLFFYLLCFRYLGIKFFAN